MSELSVAGVARNWSENPRLGKVKGHSKSHVLVAKIANQIKQKVA